MKEQFFNYLRENSDFKKSGKAHSYISYTRRIYEDLGIDIFDYKTIEDVDSLYKSFIKDGVYNQYNRDNRSFPSATIKSYLDFLRENQNCTLSLSDILENLYKEKKLQPRDYWEQIYKDFQTSFGKDALLSLSGKKLLYKLYGKKEDDSLTYNLEFSKSTSELGGIKGGFANKFSLFYKKDRGEWILKTASISEEEAISFAERSKKDILEIINVCEYQEVYSEPNEVFFGKLIDLNLDIININNSWVIKLCHMLFPKLFCCWYKYSYQRFYLEKLNHNYDENKVRNAIEMASLAKSYQMTTKEFSTVIDVKFGHPPEVKDISTSIEFDEDIQDIRKYWLYAPGENSYLWESHYHNGIMALGWDSGDLSEYSSKSELLEEGFTKTTALALWEFYSQIKKGDIVYVKKGRRKIIGRGIVTSDYEYDENVDADKTGLYRHIRKVNWLNNGEWDSSALLAMKTLTDITQNLALREEINNFFEESDEDISEPIKTFEHYAKEDFLEDVFISESEYDRLKSLLLRKQNIILQGAPGVGKTFMSKRLAYSIMGKKDPDKVMFVQFHQSYGYEDFVLGYRPTENGFKLGYGPFYEFCKKAQEDSDNPYFMIIDEINRGNISKILGELLMLIESDKRGQNIRLTYGKELFSVPKNLYIIGMMNTADRSLAVIDYALRRRFAFYQVEPAFNTSNFKKQISDNKLLSKVVNAIEQLNIEIRNCESLGNGFQIGHSFFCGKNISNYDSTTIKDIIVYEVIPLLSEYWFDDQDKFNFEKQKLLAVFDD